MHKNVEIIAEVKTKSPFGFEAEKSWEELFDIANTVGDIISIHTDPRWGGSFELVTKARKLTDKPILAKGIHETDEDVKQAFDAGADWVLVVGRIPRVHLDRCMIEPFDLTELKEVPANMCAVWNNRNLETGLSAAQGTAQAGGAKKETFAQARKIFHGWLCQASHIKTVDDIQDGANAVLVGTHLAEFAKSLK